MPFVMFRTEPVKQALERGISFIDRFIFNDLSFSHRLSFILWQRFKLGLFRNSRLSFLDPVRSVYDHQTPCYVFSDTGAWKQTALRVALFSEPTTEYPMTLLQNHSDALITATEETARHPISENPEWELL